jgi:rare lipoprotein A (peptidoglycan hydrolase)
MGRWLVILSLGVIAAASAQLSDVPLRNSLRSSLTLAPLAAHSDEAQPFGADTATPNFAEPATVSQAQEPMSARQPDAESQAREPPDFPKTVVGWQVHKLLSFPEPVTGPQIREPRKLNLTDCNGGKRIISAFYWQGQRTASGQRFDPRAMTAAHRTLPFGTHLTVTNPRTGKSVTVVINDRGPFVSGVVLDLSLGAAQAIGMHGTGSVCIF